MHVHARQRCVDINECDPFSPRHDCDKHAYCVNKVRLERVYVQACCFKHMPYPGKKHSNRAMSSKALPAHKLHRPHSFIHPRVLRSHVCVSVMSA
jgi:hypothetical protein